MATPFGARCKHVFIYVLHRAPNGVLAKRLADAKCPYNIRQNMHQHDSISSSKILFILYATDEEKQLDNIYPKLRIMIFAKLYSLPFFLAVKDDYFRETVIYVMNIWLISDLTPN